MTRLILLGLFILTSVGHAEPWRITTEPFPPYFAPNLKNQGWLSEVTLTALKEQGIEAQIEFVQWSRAMKLAQSGQRTAVLGAYYKQSRASQFLYSVPVAESHTGLIQRRNGKLSFNGELTSLKPYVISKGENYAVSEAFDNAPFLSITRTRDLPTSLYMLLRGRVELVAGTHEVAKYWLSHDDRLTELGGLKKVEFIKPELATHRLYLIFPIVDAESEQRRKTFAIGMKKLANSDELTDILSRHGFSLSEQQQYKQRILDSAFSP
ncbi:hypothetical protein HMF8227_01956 [Saliniradius amylolyticus]|uniref:Solute-binding protein family 3/N-terminal domain-containing protein n=1 Tax=Saliniradius amylolyticus TaxID=2183582 RepID=A0A2S2E441_9ALTE|nr:transporter substrate-binding domain-containing protein [Saliniradius amylolyticus]AWL12426.1 hypothetical protein HMF8227_01956 [Saliniradius amylolyticus]